MRESFTKTLLEIAHKDRNVHLITGDLGYGVLKPFWEQLPNQFSNVGIAEQNMASFAAGMAHEGKIVFMYSIGNFSTLRCIEQIRNDCAYVKANVKIVCVGGGFAYGAAGMSHHATEDLSILRALPNTTVIAPADSVEAECATKAIYKKEGTCYLRLGKGMEKRVHQSIDDFRIGKAIHIIKGKKIALFVTGAIMEEVIKTMEKLHEKEIYPSLYSFPTIKPIDKETIEECASKYDRIVTIEEHNIIGGVGSAVAEVMVELPDSNARLIKIGINDTYANVVGTQEYLRDYYGISANKIFEKIMNYFDKEK